MPIIEASWGVKFGTFMKLANSRTRPRLMPMPNSAIKIGRPIASNDPNVMSRMMIAARRPTASAPPGGSNCANWMTLPPNSIWSPGPSVCPPRSMIRSTSALPTSAAATSN